jgi:hypothetical protein
MPKHFLFNPFREYADRVVGSFRFGHDEETRGFIEYVLDRAEKRKRLIESGAKFWRAQLGHGDIARMDNDGVEYDSIRPCTPGRMTPSSSFVGNGRANPVGIAYWYAATDPETAVAEMRPWQGAVLTVAELQAKRNMQLINCGNTHPMLTLYNNVAESVKEDYVWNSIGQAFSRPIAPTTSDFEYVPTQMLAEAFRIKGFDGIQYKSHLGEGMNVVVFDLSALEMGDRELWTATRVSYELERHGDEKSEY